MVESICVVAAHVYVEQCTDMVNGFKANYKDDGVTSREISQAFLLLNLNMLVTWFGFV